MKQLKYAEFQGGSGYWYINCPDAIGKAPNQWWYMARIRGLSPAAYLEMLIKDYHAIVKFNGKIAAIYWAEKDYSYCHKLLLNTNKILRDKKVIIDF